MSESDGEMLQRLGIDGHAWASEYCKRFGEQYPDLETIHGWFANAIMAGVDHEGRKLAAREKRMREVAEGIEEWSQRPWIQEGTFVGLRMQLNEWRAKLLEGQDAMRLGETVDSGGPAAPHVSDRREERGTAPEASGQGAPRVEDSHAKLAAEMRGAAARWGGALPRCDTNGFEWAARVEQLGLAVQRERDACRP